MKNKASRPKDDDAGHSTGSAQALRQRAEEIAQGLPPDQDITLHELRVHQIELEMQNEELRRTQDELATARKRYFDLYDLAPVGYVTTGETGRILEANLTAATLLGVSRGALVKQPISRFIISKDKDIYILHLKKILETGKPQTFELRMVKKDGIQFWARLEATAAQGPDCELVCRIVISDITGSRQQEESRSRLEAQLQQSQKMASLGTMVGGIAHELRNPLTLSSSYSQLLMGDNCSDQARIEFAGKIRKGIDRASAIVENLLRFALPSIGPMGPVNLASLIRETVPLVSQQARDKNVEVVLELPGEPLMVSGMPTLLEQVFLNLFLNSIAAMPEGGLLRISGIKMDTEVILSVCDTGCGIPKENMDQIFDPFFTTRQAVGGVGLGLPICYAIVEKHKGRIEVESIPGKQTVFAVHIPAGGA